MSYLSFNSILPKSSYNEAANYQALDEDTQTVLHNVWSRIFAGGGHVLNSKSWTLVLTILSFLFSFLAAGLSGGLSLLIAWGPFLLIRAFVVLGGFVDWVDKQYFDSLWKLSKEKENAILNWCRSEKGAFFIDNSSKEALKGVFADLDFSDEIQKKSGFKKSTNIVGRSNTRLATRRYDNPDVVHTSTTCICVLDPKRSGFYVVYPTFDTEHIYDIKVLCAENQNSNKPKFFAKKLDQWDKVSYKDCKVNGNRYFEN